MKKLESLFYDVLVIGGGNAGLAAAIAAAEEGVSVALITKGKAGFAGSSVISNAVFSAIFSEGDSPDIFYEDIVKGSRWLTDKKLARILAEESTQRVHELETKYGVKLEREQRIATPGHSYPRRVYAGGGKGKNVTTAMRAYALEAGVDFKEQARLIDLLVDGNCVTGGVIEHDNGLSLYYSPAVILATGGFGGLYGSSDNPRDVTGEGIGIAFRHGATLVDMEFVQFYPYRLKEPANIDVLTKIFGKGAYMFNENQERFMEKYPKKELETRDVLCYEMYKQNKVYLDFSRVPDEVLKEDSPDLYRLYKKGYKGRWVMHPVQHYCMGGIQTDEWGRTNLKGLYACGECAGGLHGANRLAGGSLTETLVFGHRAGKMAAKERGNLVKADISSEVLKRNESKDELTPSEEKELIMKVKNIMWEKAGIERTTATLTEAVNELKTMIDHLQAANGISALQLADKLISAWACAYAGSQRKESRGAHQLQNIKEEKKEWEKKIIVQKDHAGLFQ